MAVVPFVNPGSKRKPAEVAALTGMSHLRIVRKGFIFDACRGTFHRVSESGDFIIAQLKGGTLAAELPTIFARRYGISSAMAERDIMQCLNGLSSIGLGLQKLRPVGRRKCARTELQD